jgi:hypothetical protein
MSADPRAVQMTRFALRLTAFPLLLKIAALRASAADRVALFILLEVASTFSSA